jgi:hypothetical protein
VTNKRIQQFEDCYNKAMELADEIEDSDIVEVFKHVFKNKNVVAVIWCQNTPSWNDGDPCTFRQGDVHKVTKEMLLELEEGERFKNLDELPPADQDALFDEISLDELHEIAYNADYRGFDSSIPDLIAERMYGDAHVCITRTGKVRTSEYSDR